jgi:hypothetical protein
MRIRPRLAKLEAQRRPRGHHTPIVMIPSRVEPDEWERYLQTLPCPCGVVQCEQRTWGLVLPEQMSVEAWEPRYVHRQCHGSKFHQRNGTGRRGLQTLYARPRSHACLTAPTEARWTVLVQSRPCVRRVISLYGFRSVTAERRASPFTRLVHGWEVIGALPRQT